MKDIQQKKPKIAILFPAFFGGGAEAVCAWILQSIQNLYDLELITFSSLNVEELNAQYGTEINSDKVKIIKIITSWPLKGMLTNSHSMFTLRHHLLMRHFKRHLLDNYDLAISAFNEMDLGKPGIQYIHYPIFGEAHDAARQLAEYPDSTLRRIYRKMCFIFSAFSQDNMRKNFTLVNSKWTGNIVSKLYNIDTTVVYPPATKEYITSIPWELRENGFVMVSRIVQEKRIEVAIAILSEVRKRGHSVTLHIAGEVGEPKYWNKLLDATKDQEWISWEKQLPRDKYMSLLSRNRYGIHAKKNEPFGIGIAEMVESGCIPFLPADGGQVEVIEGLDWLVWTSEEDAVAKICTLLSSQKLRKTTIDALDLKKRYFLSDQFVAEIQTAVSQFISER